MRVLRLVELHRAPECLVIGCALDDLRFHVTIWYEDLDLVELGRTYGDDAIDRIALHVALFQLNAACSLRPDAIELGRWARFATPALVALWQRVFRGVWAQWRYEHDLPDYAGPAFVDVPADAPPAPPPPRPVKADAPWLAFCGGGKDSLVALRLLERAGLPFATLAYSASIYGAAERQHALIDRVAASTARTRAERMWMLDDLLDAPVARLRPSLGARSVLAGETPASVFAALPVALARGYRGFVVAHEAGANAPNLVWGATGEGVNHQWGKGWEAERLLDAYVGRELAAGVRYFSLLQPVHDEVIFELLARDAALAPLTHSCNVAKPWCGRCAKCAYVWLQMAAHLPREVVAATFGAPTAIGDDPANAVSFREMLGLAEHTPFECVGAVPEARLALVLARERGMLGPALAALAAQVGDLDVAAVARELVGVGAVHGMPDDVAGRVIPILREAAASAATRLGVTR